MIGYLDEVIGLFVLILPKMSGYIKIFKDKGGNKKKKNKLMSLHIDDNNLSKKHKTIYKIEGFLNIELDALLMIYIYI